MGGMRLVEETKCYVGNKMLFYRQRVRGVYTLVFRRGMIFTVED